MHTWIELPTFLFKDFSMQVSVDDELIAAGDLDAGIKFLDTINVNLKDQVTEWLDEEGIVVEFRRTDDLIEVGFDDVNTAMRFKLKWSIRNVEF